MKFFIPVKVYEESNCIENHAQEIADLGSCALIVTGRHSAKACGALDDVAAALEKYGKKYVIFNQVEENPSRETIMAGRDLGLESKADFVIAIGGGSPMDAGKAIALMIAQPDEGIDYLYSKQESFSILPIVAIPTTCGTGSEVTAVSVLTNRETQKKGSIPFKIFPDLALLDEKYLHSMPLSKICDTAVDAMAHMMESYLSSSATDFSRLFVKEGLEAWSQNKDVLSGKRKPEAEDYRRLLYASTMGGMAIAHTGTSIPHGMSYAATYQAKVTHGRACGYYLTGFLRECGEEGCRILPQMAGFSGIDELEAFLFEICHMTIDEIPEALRIETAEQMASNTEKLATCKIKMTPEMLRRIAKL